MKVNTIIFFVVLFGIPTVVSSVAANFLGRIGGFVWDQVLLFCGIGVIGGMVVYIWTSSIKDSFNEPHSLWDAIGIANQTVHSVIFLDEKSISL